MKVSMKIMLEQFNCVVLTHKKLIFLATCSAKKGRQSGWWGGNRTGGGLQYKQYRIK